MPSQSLQNDVTGNLTFADRPNAAPPRSAQAMVRGPLTGTRPTRCRYVLSIESVQERLELLLALNVPCEVKGAGLAGNGDAGRGIRRTERNGGYFSLIGENFSLHMNENCIAVVCVGSIHASGGRAVELEFRGTEGGLCARVTCAEDSMTPTWCDVLDSLIYAHHDHSLMPPSMGFEYHRPVVNTSRFGQSQIVPNAETGLAFRP